MQTEKNPPMNATGTTLEDVLALARRLPSVDQARLVARLAPMVERVLDQAAASPSPSRTPIRGLLADLGPAPSAEEIDEVRREMWSSFGAE
jgi:hypothetical protein